MRISKILIAMLFLVMSVFISPIHAFDFFKTALVRGTKGNTVSQITVQGVGYSSDGRKDLMLESALVDGLCSLAELINGSDYELKTVAMSGRTESVYKETMEVDGDNAFIPGMTFRKMVQLRSGIEEDGFIAEKAGVSALEYAGAFFNCTNGKTQMPAASVEVGTGKLEQFMAKAGIEIKNPVYEGNTCVLLLTFHPAKPLPWKGLLEGPLKTSGAAITNEGFLDDSTYQTLGTGAPFLTDSAFLRQYSAYCSALLSAYGHFFDFMIDAGTSGGGPNSASKRDTAGGLNLQGMFVVSEKYDSDDTCNLRVQFRIKGLKKKLTAGNK